MVCQAAGEDTRQLREEAEAALAGPDTPIFKLPLQGLDHKGYLWAGVGRSVTTQETPTPHPLLGGYAQVHTHGEAQHGEDRSIPSSMLLALHQAPDSTLRPLRKPLLLGPLYRQGSRYREVK